MLKSFVVKEICHSQKCKCLTKSKSFEEMNQKHISRQETFLEVKFSYNMCLIYIVDSQQNLYLYRKKTRYQHFYEKIPLFY